MVTGGLTILLSLTGRAETLAEISSALFMVSYALLCLSVVVMRSSRPRWYRPAFRVPFYPVLPVAAGLLCLAVILTMAPESRTAGLGLVGASLVWYFAWVRRQATVIGEFRPLWERERPLEAVIEAAEAAIRAKGHEILIPLLPDTKTKPLLSLAAALAQADDRRVIARSDKAELTVLRIVRPAEDLDLEAERRGLRHLVEEALGGPDPRVRERILVREAVVEGILEEAQNGRYDLLVIGASNEWAVKSLLLGAVPDTVADRAPCSVLMVRRYEPTGISTIRRVVRSIKGW